MQFLVRKDSDYLANSSMVLHVDGSKLQNADMLFSKIILDNYDLLITVCSCCSSFLCVCFLTRKQATFRIMQHLRRAEKRKKTYFIAVELCKRGSRPQPLFLRLLNETLPLLLHFPIFCLLTNLGFLSKHFIVRQLFSKGLRKHCDKISWFPLIKNTKLLSHIAWKLLKMSHLNFGIFHQFLSY